MAVLKLYGNAHSSAATRVIACLYEKELDFELIPVDTRAGENKKEPYISLNPFGEVPAFEDGEVKVFESRAITKYLCHAYAGKGTELIYSDPKKWANVTVWMEVEAHQFDPPASKLVFEYFAKPILGLEMDKDVVAESEAKLGKVLDVYDARLGKSKYLAGDTFTLADLHHLPSLHYLMNTPAKELFKSRRLVSAWCADISARASWTKIVEMEKKDKA